MKKVLVTIIGCALTIVLIVVAITFFRNPSNLSNHSLNESEVDFSATEREDEVDEASRKFAKEFEVNENNVVSTGQSIVSTKFLCTVTSWEVGKDVFEYEIPEEISLEDYGVMVDGNGYIINEYSYVIVHISAENISDELVENDYLWSKFRLRFINPPSEYQTTGEVRFLGEKPLREYIDDYFAETFAVNEKKEIALVYVVPDGILENDGMYLELNPFGVVITDKDQDIRRYLLLN